jgi:hypothetical protein
MSIDYGKLSSKMSARSKEAKRWKDARLQNSWEKLKELSEQDSVHPFSGDEVNIKDLDKISKYLNRIERCIFAASILMSESEKILVEVEDFPIDSYIRHQFLPQEFEMMIAESESNLCEMVQTLNVAILKSGFTVENLQFMKEEISSMKGAMGTGGLPSLKKYLSENYEMNRESVVGVEEKKKVAVKKNNEQKTVVQEKKDLLDIEEMLF